MIESRRAERMKRHHERNEGKNAALNMVSLMDIFTILVFFLLVSAASSDILPPPKNITLPRSTAENAPKENVVIMVGDNKIMVQGKEVSDTKSVLKTDKLMIMPLYETLQEIAASKKSVDASKGVTIMGDQKTPYELMKKIMLTCTAAKFVDISFAVNRVTPKDG